MKLITHLVVSMILALALFPIFGIKSFIVLVSGFLIDIDHLLYFKGSFKETYRYFKNIDSYNNIKKSLGIIKIFHTVEFLVIIAISSFYYEIALIFLIGLTVHIIMDIFYVWKTFKVFRIDSFIFHNSQKWGAEIRK